ncbi:uncharacterized protein LOC100253628 isoform X2 [Vitis vinifera]|uniref:uncharacterized protein LOC100253628 isoform X2 n=1 Tax=Vitis vinifera TaxID=29760 RepID=UPI00015CD682|eukprot:XP_010647175.1 PREDICTED: uncharacterized protein LOC100253628 isoform X2 [Vitis vinifera]
MHRISSATRVSDEFFNSTTSPSATPDADQLPTYDPLSHVAKKERTRIRSAENAIHAIPVVLLLCVMTLWFFSNPVDIVNKGASIVPRQKGLTVIGNIKSDPTQNGLLKDLEQDSDPTKEFLHQKGPKSTENES